MPYAKYWLRADIDGWDIDQVEHDSLYELLLAHAHELEADADHKQETVDELRRKAAEARTAAKAICPKDIDGQFTSTHAIARFLLEGPDVNANLDYGDELRVQAEWTESSKERFHRLLAAEPDPNPPEDDNAPEAITTFHDVEF